MPRTLLVKASSGIGLHQRHVLVRRRMKDDLGFEPVEDGVETHSIANVRNHRLELDAGILLRQSRQWTAKMLFSP